MFIYGIGALSALLCMCALLVDVGLFEQTKIHLQAAADAAAIGAVFNYQNGGTYQSGAQADATLNGVSADAVTTVLVNTPPTSGAYIGNPYAVQATVKRVAGSEFLPISQHLLTATATAMRVPTACVFALSRSSALRPSLRWINQAVQYSCPTYVGSSFNLSGAATVSNTQIFVSANSANSYGSPSPSAIFGAPSLADPLSYLPSPSATGPCTYSNTGAITSNTTLNPGIYCGGLTIGDDNSSPTITFNSGLYVLTGPLVVNRGNVSGAGITFYVAGGSGSNASSINNQYGTLSAPISGAWQGILFYSDRSLAPDSATLTLANWNRGSKTDGIFYLPHQGLIVSNIALKPVAYLGVVADYIQMNNTDFQPAANYSSLSGGNPLRPVGGGGGIVE